MSGFAGINGEPDGGPLLPPIALTDEITALAAAFATMTALWSGVGQVVDVNLLESLFQCMGPLPGAYATSGYLQPRLGSRSEERRGGKECVSTCRSRWSRTH